MPKEDRDFINPVRLMGYENDDIISKGGFGAVVARAGIGKTSLLVQLAISNMKKKKKILHVSLNDPVKKITLWYKEIYNNLTDKYNIDKNIWEIILPHRFIMTFRVDTFSIPRLEERFNDLIIQNIFIPEIIIIDGLDFEDSVREQLIDLKNLAKKHSIRIWFTVKTHRHEKPGPQGMPPQLSDVSDMFEVVIGLVPQKDKIYIKTIKEGTASKDHPQLFMDPSSMLVNYNQ